MKGTWIVGFLIILGIWSINNIYLNEVSKTERDIKKLEREIEELKRDHSSAILAYDRGMDLDLIKKKLEEIGMKQTREINYFKIEEEN